MCKIAIKRVSGYIFILFHIHKIWVLADQVFHNYVAFVVNFVRILIARDSSEVQFWLYLFIFWFYDLLCRVLSTKG